MNKFLFLDFGASNVKAIVYDVGSQRFFNQKIYTSPFFTKNKILKTELRQYLVSILSDYPDVFDVVPCTILGGGYEGNTYYSWKSNKKENLNYCLISGLFSKQSNHHVHADHGGNIKKIQYLGSLDDKKFYSSLGDTDCVKRSFELCDDSCILNLGTGSQVMTKDDIIKFIPSGRALNSFKFFFDSVNIDMFEKFSEITLNDLTSSSMTFDLNIFKEAANYKKNAGSILFVEEKNFTVDNFIKSLFRSYIDQYESYIGNKNIIYLTGGISRKYPVIKEYMEYKLKKKVILRSKKIEDTFLGIKNKIIKDYEHINNRR